MKKQQFNRNIRLLFFGTMKLTVFSKNDSVLLIGEGNFSFSVALLQLNLKINITATCYEANVYSAIGKKNIECLVNNGQYLTKELRPGFYIVS